MKRLTLTLLALAALLIWGGMTASAARSRRAGVREANKAVVRRYFEERNRGNLAVIDELVSPTFIGHRPAGSTLPDLHGPADLREFLTTNRTAFPDAQTTVENLIAEGDQVVARWTLRGTQKGTLKTTVLGDIPPTNKPVAMSGITIYRIEDGKIVEGWSIADTLGELRQLGVLPPAASARQ
jgi:steroid delta-isomerase-like uncharacterized protein